MPELLLDILRNAANTPEYHKLHARAIECAGPFGLLEVSYQLTVRHSYRVLSAQRSAIAVGRSDAKADTGVSLNFSSEYKSKDFQ
jgi:hypothetical protein